MTPMTQASSRTAGRDEAGPPRESAVTLLVVGIDDAVLTVIRRMLERRGFRTLLARCADDARSIVAAHSARLAGVVLDLAMPGMDADRLFGALRRMRPALPVLLTGGYGEDAVAARLTASSHTAFLAKPFGLDALARKAADLFGAGPARSGPEAGDGRPAAAG